MEVGHSSSVGKSDRELFLVISARSFLIIYAQGFVVQYECQLFSRPKVARPDHGGEIAAIEA
jgi:hypothetical protein